MLKIEIEKQETRNVNGTSNRTQKPYNFEVQTGWVYLPGDPHPTRIDITLDQGSSGYPVGQYELSPESFRVNRFGQLEVGQIKLLRNQAGKAAA